MAKTRDVEAKPRNDAYTGLLGISFLALLGGCVLMYLDHEELGKAPSKGELKVDVPGVSPATKGGTLPARVDPAAGAGIPAPVPEPEKKAPEPEKKGPEPEKKPL